MSIDVCRGLGISPLRTKHPPEFFVKPILAQHRPQSCIFRLFQKSETFRCKNRARSKLYLKHSCGYLWASNFLCKLCVSIGIHLVSSQDVQTQQKGASRHYLSPEMLRRHSLVARVFFIPQIWTIMNALDLKPIDACTNLLPDKTKNSPSPACHPSNSN